MRISKPRAVATTTVSDAKRPRAIGVHVDRLHRHAVQFYESDRYLVDLLTDFASAGLALGEAVVVIGRPERCAALRAALSRRDVDVEREFARGALTILDAR